MVITSLVAYSAFTHICPGACLGGRICYRFHSGTPSFSISQSSLGFGKTVFVLFIVRPL